MNNQPATVPPIRPLPPDYKTRSPNIHPPHGHINGPAMFPTPRKKPRDYPSMNKNDDPNANVRSQIGRKKKKKMLGSFLSISCRPQREETRDLHRNRLYWI